MGDRTHRLTSGFSDRFINGRFACLYTEAHARVAAELLQQAGERVFIGPCAHHICQKIGAWRLDTAAEYDPFNAALVGAATFVRERHD